MSAPAVRSLSPGGTSATGRGQAATIPEGAACRAFDEARRQGLPALATDPETCRAVASLVVGAMKKAAPEISCPGAALGGRRDRVDYPKTA